MRKLLRSILLYALAFYLLPTIITSVTIEGGIPSYLLIGLVFSFIIKLVRPILKILTLPLNMITFGIFTFVLNALLLYLLTLFVPFITIAAFPFNGFTFAGFVVPKIYFNIFFTYVLASFIISAIVDGISWIFEKR